ncbi:hypothetical protein ACP5PY_29225 [Photobacterium leiognathi subsp. mandapamensis]
MAINQADMAMKGRHWEYAKNQPDSTLMEFLDEKVLSTSRRIKEATGVDVTPIYYSAGYKEADESQQPYNLSKLLAFILRHTKPEKRAVIVQDVNKETDFGHNDGEGDYGKEIHDSLLDSLIRSVGQVGEKAVEKVVTVASKALDAGWKVLKTVGSSIARIFGF